MVKITQKQLIEQLRGLKEIKPRQEWVLLLKSQLLSKEISKFEFRNSNFFFGIFSQKSLAYSFAMVLLIFIGLVGFAQRTVPGDLLFPVKKIAEQSQAVLSGKTGLEQNVSILTNRINDLAKVAKKGRADSMPLAINEINADASELAKNLKKNTVKNSETLKEIAVSLKTLADIPGADFSENENVMDLYQTVVQSQINDLEKTTLTDEQKLKLDEIKNLYKEEKYTEALEKILLL